MRVCACLCVYGSRMYTPPTISEGRDEDSLTTILNQQSVVCYIKNRDFALEKSAKKLRAKLRNACGCSRIFIILRQHTDSGWQDSDINTETPSRFPARLLTHTSSLLHDHGAGRGEGVITMYVSRSFPYVRGILSLSRGRLAGSRTR